MQVGRGRGTFVGAGSSFLDLRDVVQGFRVLRFSILDDPSGIAAETCGLVECNNKQV